jgi:hypothetical protein
METNENFADHDGASRDDLNYVIGTDELTTPGTR